jgi:FkbM family methyltransferase
MSMSITFLEFIGRKLRPVELALLLKFLLRIKRKEIELSDGRKYAVDPVSDLGLRLAKSAEYETEMTKAISEILNQGDYFIDLGANEGYFSILGAKICGARGHVLAIEPQERLWKVIHTNASINNLTNIQLLPFGIGSKKEQLTLQLYSSLNSGASSFSSGFNFGISFAWLRKKLYGSQIAQVIPLDEMAESLPLKMKLIKIDIEGFELEALKGSSRLIQEKRFENLLIEIHPHALKSMGQSEDDIDELLKAHGYSKHRVSSNLNLYSAQ